MWRGDFYGRICLSVCHGLTFGSSYLESSFGATKIVEWTMWHEEAGWTSQE